MEAFVLPGKFILGKLAEMKKQQQEQRRRKVTERELTHLHHKIDKLLTRLEGNEPEPATSQEEECAICISAKATMQTFPCGHRVVCRKCFVKTIQMTVSQRLLPLRCVICRAKILRLKQLASGRHQNDSQPPNYHTLGETVPHTLSTYFRDHGSAKPIKASGNPTKIPKLSYPYAHDNNGKLLAARGGSGTHQPAARKSNNSLRLANRQLHKMKSCSPLLPIPETEELALVGSVDKLNPIADFDSEMWKIQNDFKKAKPRKKKHAPSAMKKCEELSKLWMKIRQIPAPSIVKVIKNKLKQ